MPSDVKYVQIVIDDFSSRSQHLPSVHMYDYVSNVTSTSVDLWYNDYYWNVGNVGRGTVDSTVVNSVQSFYASSDVIGSSAIVAQSTSYVRTDYYYLRDYYATSTTVTTCEAVDSVYESSAAHGDWVLDAFFSQLDDPSCVEVIAIDIDFANNQDYQALFSTTATLNGQTVPLIEAIVYDAYQDFYSSNNAYLIAGINASFGGGNFSTVSYAIDSALANDAVVVQAAGNVSQSAVPWSAYYPNVITVGAWNVDSNSNAMGSNPASASYVDIYADGYVARSGWGNNFGTSFAAPRVSAEIINLFDQTLSSEIIAGRIDLNQSTDLSDAQLTSVTNYVVSSISSDVVFRLQGGATWYGPVQVLSDDVLDGTVMPSVLPGQYQNTVYTAQIADARISEPPSVQFTSTTGTANEGNSGTQTVTATAQLSTAAVSTVTIPVTYSGTATAGTDYTPGSGTITIAAGSTTGSATFAVSGDGSVEGNETVVLTMGTPTNATLGSNTSYTHTIVNDDTPAGVSKLTLAQFGPNGSSVGFAGPDDRVFGQSFAIDGSVVLRSFELHLGFTGFPEPNNAFFEVAVFKGAPNDPSRQKLYSSTIDFSANSSNAFIQNVVNGTWISAPLPSVLLNGSGTYSLELNPSSSIPQLSINVSDRDSYSFGTFYVLDPQGWSFQDIGRDSLLTLGYDPVATGTILSTPPTIEFSLLSGSTDEGNSGSQTVTATAQLSSAAVSVVTIPVTYSGTASSGTDYTPGSGTITIAAGATTGNATFTVSGDGSVEGNETVVLTMGTPTNATLGSNISYTHTIMDDDKFTLAGTIGGDNLKGTVADEVIIGSRGNDTVDGAAGSDTLDLSSFAWSLTDRGSSTYTVTGTEKAFVISYVGEDAKSYKMTVNR